MTDSETQIREHTLNWVKSFVIGLNLCPFAKAPVNKGQLKIQVSNSQKKNQALEEVMSEIFILDEHPEIETTLLVYSSAFKDFFTYLDFVDLAEQLIYELEYEGIYQVATFHPEYCFADSEPNDVANYSNRSPYPMLHILREDSLAKAINAYGDTDNIPQKNIETLRQLGEDKIKALLKSCQETL